jgi:hypothetical protein
MNIGTNEMTKIEEPVCHSELPGPARPGPESSLHGLFNFCSTTGKMNKHVERATE